VFLRAPVFKAYARLFGVDLSEVRLALADHPSLAAFFVRRLEPDARSFPSDAEALPSPVDGVLQASDRVRAGSVLQAKGRPYSLSELLCGAAEDVDLEGGHAWTLYLGPRDYHRIHAPIDCRLSAVHWFAGARYSVHPKVLAKRSRVLSINERCVLRLDGADGPLWLVCVGALNVGRIRVVGVEPGGDVAPPAPRFSRGDELARFEMGSTVVLIAPRGAHAPLEGQQIGARVRMGEVIGYRVTSRAHSEVRAHP
jgi:phosphatidylserine decarboxylase